MTTIRVHFEMDGTVRTEEYSVKDGAAVHAKIHAPERGELHNRAYVKLPSIERTLLIARAFLIDIEGPVEGGHR